MGTALVVGANRGIGLWWARHLAGAGHTVIATARNPEDADELSDVAEVLRCDVSSDESVAALAEALGTRQLDRVVHNAGILWPDNLEEGSAADVLTQLDVNAVGAFRTIQAVRSRLAPGAVIGLMTSRMGSIADNTSGGMYGYRASKAALNAIGVSLARDLAPVPLLLLHPGHVRTEMTRKTGSLGPEEAAAKLLALLERAASGEGDAMSGRFWHADGYELPW